MPRVIAVHDRDDATCAIQQATYYGLIKDTAIHFEVIDGLPVFTMDRPAGESNGVRIDMQGVEELRNHLDELLLFPNGFAASFDDIAAGRIDEQTQKAMKAYAVLKEARERIQEMLK